MPTFSLLPSLNKNKVFLLNKSEVEKRLDPLYYDPRSIDLERKISAKNPKKLRDYIVSMSGGATPKRDEEDKYYTTDDKNGVPFLRVQNITEWGLDLSDVKYINKKTHENELSRSKVFENDLLVTITGRICSAAVAPKNFEGNINQHSVVIKTQNKETSTYLAAYLNSGIAHKLAIRRTTGGTRPALDYPALLSIPILHDPRIISIIHNAVARKKQYDLQTKQLLANIDEYLLKELGINLPKTPVNSVKNRLFLKSINQLSGNRLDPFYYSKYFEDLEYSIIKGKYPTITISSIARNIDTGRTPAKSAYVDELVMNKLPIVKAGSYTGDFIDLSKCDYTLTDFNGNTVFEGDIFILGAAHQAEYVGKKVYYLNQKPTIKTFFVGELVRISVNKSKYESSLLFSILKTKLYALLLNREKRGQTSHLYPYDVKHLIIPLPQLGKQKEMATHITAIRKQAQGLKDKTKEVLEQANKEIVKILLG